MKLQITCKLAVDYISKKEEGKLSAWQRVQLWRHLWVCSLCRLFAQQNRLITKALSRKQKNENQLPAEKKQEIIDAVLKK